MPNPQKNEAVVWDAIDWDEIAREEEQQRSDSAKRARIEEEKHKAIVTQPTAAEVERGKLEEARQALETERQAIEVERKRLADVEATRKAEDARRADAERMEREHREQEARMKREIEERSRREEELRLQQAREGCLRSVFCARRFCALLEKNKSDRGCDGKNASGNQ